MFAANDRNTIGALRALRRVDRQLALVGFDDFELAHLLDPPVTVVRSHPARPARLAVKRIFLRLFGYGGAPESLVVATVLARGSGEIRP